MQALRYRNRTRGQTDKRECRRGQLGRSSRLSQLDQRHRRSRIETDQNPDITGNFMGTKGIRKLFEATGCLPYREAILAQNVGLGLGLAWRS